MFPETFGRQGQILLQRVGSSHTHILRKRYKHAFYVPCLLIPRRQTMDQKCEPQIAYSRLVAPITPCNSRRPTHFAEFIPESLIVNRLTADIKEETCIALSPPDWRTQKIGQYVMNVTADWNASRLANSMQREQILF